MNGNEFGGRWNGSVPPGFCGTCKLLLQGGGPLRVGFCPTCAAGAALGSTEETLRPLRVGQELQQSECPD